jgi:hypothetical protein
VGRQACHSLVNVNGEYFPYPVTKASEGSTRGTLIDFIFNTALKDGINPFELLSDAS